MKKILQTERQAQFQCSPEFLAHMNTFWQHYLGNKKPAFLGCNLEQVYVAIWRSSKITIFFRTAKPTLAGFLKIPKISLTQFP